jgi:hypothetical protein
MYEPDVRAAGAERSLASRSPLDTGPSPDGCHHVERVPLAVGMWA